MRCPYCEGETRVIDKRESSEFITRRRRECLKCKKRFTTYERIESKNIMILKKDKRREPFNRDKLKSGIIRACEKRPVSLDEIEKVVNEIEARLREEGTNEISSKFIGELIMKKLKKLDKVAYIRFASVYRDFKDVDEFKDAIKEFK
ncbi:transcriptional regulator NrdR [Candidatus Pacearchaeota archaeon]|nr:transcriptional regulator NrdR [Candidatus Pacearchaeota archaeon]